MEQLNNTILINKTEISSIFTNIENENSCTIFNKESILNQIKDQIISNELKDLILKNLITSINAEDFKKYGFNILFIEDDVKVLFNHNIIKDINDIDTIISKLDHIKSDLYKDCIKNVILKLMNKDISVKYILNKIPTPYWKLYEIKCKKTQKNNTKEIEYYEKILNGSYVNKDVKIEEKIRLIERTKEEKDKDEMYRMEILSYLSDEDVLQFLNYLETMDKLDELLDLNITSSTIKDYASNLLNIFRTSKNKMKKYYILNRLLIFIEEVKKKLCLSNINKSIIISILEIMKEIKMNNDMYIIETAGITFSKEIKTRFDKMLKILEELNIIDIESEEDKYGDDEILSDDD